MSARPLRKKGLFFENAHDLRNFFPHLRLLSTLAWVATKVKNRKKRKIENYETSVASTDLHKFSFIECKVYNNEIASPWGNVDTATFVCYISSSFWYTPTETINYVPFIQKIDKKIARQLINFVRFQITVIVFPCKVWLLWRQHLIPVEDYRGPPWLYVEVICHPLLFLLSVRVSRHFVSARTLSRKVSFNSPLLWY